jgi:hypothetical protein
MPYRPPEGGIVPESAAMGRFLAALPPDTSIAQDDPCVPLPLDRSQELSIIQDQILQHLGSEPAPHLQTSGDSQGLMLDLSFSGNATFASVVPRGVRCLFRDSIIRRVVSGPGGGDSAICQLRYLQMS